MSSRFQAPRGTSDVLPDAAAERSRLEETARKILGRACYGRIETPTFEATQLFSRTVGEATDVVQKEMYTFADNSGESLTLRPEGTASIVRAYVENNLEQAGVERLYYFGPMFRYERPQAGRQRQFYQLGVELFGDPGPAVDAETIQLFMALCTACGLRGLTVRYGDGAERRRSVALRPAARPSSAGSLAPRSRARRAPRPHAADRPAGTGDPGPR